MKVHFTKYPVTAGRTTNRTDGRKKHYKNIRFSGWTETKNDIVDALRDSFIGVSQVKQYVRQALSEAEAAAQQLTRYKEILEDLNRTSYTESDRARFADILNDFTLSQKELHASTDITASYSWFDRFKQAKSEVWAPTVYEVGNDEFAWVDDSGEGLKVARRSDVSDAECDEEYERWDEDEYAAYDLFNDAAEVISDPYLMKRYFEQHGLEVPSYIEDELTRYEKENDWAY